MGFTLNGFGKPVYTDAYGLPADLQAAVDFALKYAWVQSGTAAARAALTTTLAPVGSIFTETDTGKVMIRRAAGWFELWAPSTAPGSVVPTVAGVFSVSNNLLYKQNGLLCGSIDFSLSSGTLGHGNTICTLPAGAIPAVDSFAVVVGSPSPAQMFIVGVVASTGAVTAVSPPSGRTSGSIRFAMPIPQV
jgi:hypothetical protein